MALFKIEKGESTRLATKRPYAHEGYCYFTTDDGKFYIDISGDGTADSAAVINTNRIPLNAYQADYADALYNQYKGDEVGALKLWYGPTKKYLEIAKSEDGASKDTVYITSDDDGSTSVVNSQEADSIKNQYEESTIGSLKLWYGPTEVYKTISESDEGPAEDTIYITSDDDGSTTVVNSAEAESIKNQYTEGTIGSLKVWYGPDETYQEIVDSDEGPAADTIYITEDASGEVATSSSSTSSTIKNEKTDSSVAAKRLKIWYGTQEELSEETFSNDTLYFTTEFIQALMKGQIVFSAENTGV